MESPPAFAPLPSIGTTQAKAGCFQVFPDARTISLSPQRGWGWDSVVLAAGRLYVTSRRGVTIVFRPNPEKLEVLAMNNLGEPSDATPAISDGQIFLRTNGHLDCIAE